MIRYVCDNPSCLNSFISEDLDIYNLCELCGSELIYIGKTKKDDVKNPYLPKETIEELKIKYVQLIEKSFNEGLTKDECCTVGRACRKIKHRDRKDLLKCVSSWKSDVHYKHVLTESGLMKRVKIKKRKQNER